MKEKLGWEAQEKEGGSSSGMARAIPQWIVRLEKFMGDQRTDQLQSQVLPGLIQSRMATEMPKMMGSKLAAKGMVAQIHVVPTDAEQQAFWERQIKEIQETTTTTTTSTQK